MTPLTAVGERYVPLGDPTRTFDWLRQRAWERGAERFDDDTVMAAIRTWATDAEAPDAQHRALTVLLRLMTPALLAARHRLHRAFGVSDGDQVLFDNIHDALLALGRAPQQPTEVGQVVRYLASWLAHAAHRERRRQNAQDRIIRLGASHDLMDTSDGDDGRPGHRNALADEADDRDAPGVARAAAPSSLSGDDVEAFVLDAIGARFTEERHRICLRHYFGVAEFRGNAGSLEAVGAAHGYSLPMIGKLVGQFEAYVRQELSAQ
jgi:hypothetical protein